MARACSRKTLASKSDRLLGRSIAAPQSSANQGIRTRGRTPDNSFRFPTDLSLLGGMTPKAIRKYHKRGIFTTTQLSYAFKRRKARKGRNSPLLRFRPEVQALALKTHKIYIHELPELSRQSTEIFLDIEGIPDRNFYYLIGFIVMSGAERLCHSFWANSQDDEHIIWQQFLAIITTYPTAPIYHYGSYDARAVQKLMKRYKNGDNDMIQEQRLINVNACIYGKIYFPTRTNSLKELAPLAGASWSRQDAQKIQSLVWRYRWEKEQKEFYRQLLVTYNQEDCEALHLLTNKLSELITTADSKQDIDFANHPKQHATEIGKSFIENSKKSCFLHMRITITTKLPSQKKRMCR